MTTIVPAKPYAHCSVEPSRDGEGFNVYEWGVYPKGSVLAGQEKKSFIEFSPDQYAMKLKYPGVEVSDHIVPCSASVGPAPSNYYAGDGGFYDAGEYWGDDDY